jgi:two-component system, NtrC family, response regulator AtoC
LVKQSIVVCDDEKLIRWSLCQYLESEGFQVIPAASAVECLEIISTRGPDLVCMDLVMPKMSGIQALGKLRESGNDVPVIIITAHSAVDSAIEATRLGASDYLTKPFDMREVSFAVSRALREHRVKHQVMYLQHQREAGYGDFIGNSPALAPVFAVLRKLEEVDPPTILIQGETGTGKNLIAKAMHSRGRRSDKIFMEIDCATLPEQLIESELFGHERGAFTDAKQLKRGLFEVAGAGVVFLDEIGELPLSTQVKLLSALESRRFKRVGGVTNISLDATIIAASNRTLKEEVKAGRFREDLYFRLSVIPLFLPPLRQRKDDIPALINFFLKRLGRRTQSHVKGIDGEALTLMQQYCWPGNVRELRNVMERLTILAAGEVISPTDLPSELRYLNGAGSQRLSSSDFVLPKEGIELDVLERNLLVQAMERTENNQTAAAKLLGLTRYQLRYRLEKNGLLFRK